MKIIFLGIGTNLNDRESNLKEAVARIEEYIGKIVASSSVFETEPWGFKAENEFLNMVVKVKTRLNPSGLLGRILMIESLLGRVRGEKRYASRVIDIDILLYEDLVIDEISMKIPHPLMHERKFVLVPLGEIEPELVHPVFRQTIASLLIKCKDNSTVRLHDRRKARQSDI
jgi:2-amino-4-hydroxy-6-hydroxymethyldihydropteridine diphosphokinase